jgi:hypothetical protein
VVAVVEGIVVRHDVVAIIRPVVDGEFGWII